MACGALFLRARPGNPAGLCLVVGAESIRCKGRMKMAGANLSTFMEGGKEYAVASRSPGPARHEPAAYLLPGFDEYILGYRDRSAILDTAVAGRTVMGANGMMLPTIIIDGSVAGTWKRTIGKQNIALELRPFSPLSPAHRRFRGCRCGAVREVHGAADCTGMAGDWR